MIEIIKIEEGLTPPLSYADAWPHPIFTQLQTLGEADYFSSTENLYKMWPALIFAVFFFFARDYCKRHIFNGLGRRYGIKKPAKLAKFGYQFWLGAAYTTSTIYGMTVLRDEPYFKWPLDHSASVNLWNNNPESEAIISSWMWFYYWWGTGFYLAELFAIFVEPKRSDFVEYVLHHFVTLFLLTLSAWSFNMRVGVLVLLLHDITDIFLCVAKIFHYMDKELFVNINFVLFLLSMVYLRLYCYPILVYSAWFQLPAIRGYELWSWFCAHLLLVLQVLHLYWFVLVVKMVYRLLTGVKGDVRSDDD